MKRTLENISDGTDTKDEPVMKKRRMLHSRIQDEVQGLSDNLVDANIGTSFNCLPKNMKQVPVVNWLHKSNVAGKKKSLFESDSDDEDDEDEDGKENLDDEDDEYDEAFIEITLDASIVEKMISGEDITGVLDQVDDAARAVFGWIADGFAVMRPLAPEEEVFDEEMTCYSATAGKGNEAVECRPEKVLRQHYGGHSLKARLYEYSKDGQCFFMDMKFMGPTRKAYRILRRIEPRSGDSYQSIPVPTFHYKFQIGHLSYDGRMLGAFEHDRKFVFAFGVKGYPHNNDSILRYKEVVPLELGEGCLLVEYDEERKFIERGTPRT